MGVGPARHRRAGRPAAAGVGRLSRPASPAAERTDSRRLTGPNLLLPGPGAALEVAWALDADGDRLVAAWAAHLRTMLARLGWHEPTLATRRWPGGATLAFAAPPDVLYAATEINEWAWDAATGATAEDEEAAAARLATQVAAERKPRLLALLEAATTRGLPAVEDDDALTIGLGAGGRTWPLDQLPAVGEVPWGDLHAVPVVLVTGSNGKTTTTRMLAAMARAAGHVTGWSTTDGIWVDGAEVEAGDWAGPGGARRVLRDARVGFAVLETARGGMLRRGLPVARASAAGVTNIAEDHFGEYGIHGLDDLARAKLVVARAVEPDGPLVVNAGDPVLARAAADLPARLVWFATDPALPLLAAHAARGGAAIVVDDGWYVLREGARTTPLLPVDEAPATHGGRLAHNVANLAAALALGWAAGLPVEALAAGARGFRGGAADNPGRANLFTLGDGVHALVDFAHNPDGIAALAGITRMFPGAPVTILLGQAGDRDDAAMADLARAAWSLGPAQVIVKEMDAYRRGRAPGEVSLVLRRALVAAGCPAERIALAPDELAAVRQALGGARPGALLLLLSHTDAPRVLALLGRLEAAGWRPGHPVPAGD